MDLLHAIEEQLRRPNLGESLVPLFCETLNWGHFQSQPFSRDLTSRGEVTRLMFSPVAQLSRLPVFRVDWPHDKLPTSTQRRAVYQVLQAVYVEHLLVYVTPDERQAAFVWARRRVAKVANNAFAKVRTELRVLPFAADSAARTTIEQLGQLAFSIEDGELGLSGDPGWSAVSAKLDAAFDIEAVTKAFFKTYRDLFERAEGVLPAHLDAKQRRLYTLRFFNRLIFLAFLEHKGWMRFGKRRDYLQALWDAYCKEKERTDVFHRDRLNLLFFSALSTTQEVNVVGITDRGPLNALIGNVPYLNGGLFDREEDDEKGWYFPDEIVRDILADVIYHFNFTVTESTPLDVEVAVDPEMLGKLFEELVTGRHETGSYYTPKSVVAFMCREAVKGYLQTVLPGESPPAIAQFVDDNNPIDLRNPEVVLEALRTIRVCDPACGSGAYLLGMMHELLEQRECLFATHSLDGKTEYERKLEIIQENLYGVDNDEFAVNIARLRLWLSLVVDDARNPLEDSRADVSLPNLDFKIEVGDSLTAPDPSAGIEIGFRSQFVEEYLELKRQYLTSHHGEKRALRQAIAEKRATIESWMGRETRDTSPPSRPFDWPLEFAEVFVVPAAAASLKGSLAGLVNTTAGQMELAEPSSSRVGFDIVLANPPYVRADAQFKHIESANERQREIAGWKKYREYLKKSGIYQTLFEKWDLYIPFLERAYQMLLAGGQMVFIVSDAYNAAKYAAQSHGFFLRETQIQRIDFCSDIRLFDAGVNNTILHFAKLKPGAHHSPLRVRRWGKQKDEFDDNLEILPTASQNQFGERAFRAEQGGHRGEGEFVPLEQICYVSKGMVIHADERKHQGEFTTEDVLSERPDKAHPKRFALGKDVLKWHLRNLRYLEWGTRRAPSRFSRPTFPQLQEAKEKLIAVRTPGAEPKVIYDDNSLHFDASSVGFIPWHLLEGAVNSSISKTARYVHQDPLGDRAAREATSRNFDLKYVLAIMNSAYARNWLKGERRSKRHVYPDDWKRLPIRPIPAEKQRVFAELVDKILDEYRKHGDALPVAAAGRVVEWEREIDARVASLYGVAKPAAGRGS